MPEISVWMIRKELARTPLVWAVPVLLFLGGWMVFASDYQNVHVARRATAALMAAVQTMGPLCSGLGAWAAMRAQRGGAAHLTTLSSRSRLSAQWPHLAAIVLVLVTPYLMLTLVQSFRSALRPGLGSLEAAGVLVGLAGIVVHILLGYFLGTLIPKRLTVVLLPITLYVGEVAGQDLPGALFLPTQVHTVGPFWAWQPGLLGGQTVWLVSLSVLLLGLLGLILDRRRLTSVLLALGVAGMAVSGAHLASLRGRVLMSGNAPFTYVCQARVCVHPAYTWLIPDIEQAFALTRARLAGTAAEPRTLEQRPRGIGGEPTPGRTAFHLDDPKQDWGARSVGEFVSGLPDADSCADPTADGGILSSVVMLWLASPSVGPLETPLGLPENLQTPVRTFLTLPEAEKRRWLKDHYEQFALCTLRAADLQNGSQ